MAITAKQTLDFLFLASIFSFIISILVVVFSLFGINTQVSYADPSNETKITNARNANIAVFVLLALTIIFYFISKNLK